MLPITRHVLAALLLAAAASSVAVPASAAGPALLRCGANVNCNDGAAVIRAMDNAAKRIETAAPGSPLLGSYASMCRDAQRRAQTVQKDITWSDYAAQPMLNTCNIGLLRLQ
jgi:hypothetical protein